jgi:hypothetical protein
MAHVGLVAFVVGGLLRIDAAYTLFGMGVLAVWLRYPPRRPRRKLPLE